MEYLSASLRDAASEDIATTEPTLLLRIEVSMSPIELTRILDLRRVLAFIAITVSEDSLPEPGATEHIRIFYVWANDAPTDEQARNAFVEERAAAAFGLIQDAYSKLP